MNVGEMRLLQIATPILARLVLGLAMTSEAYVGGEAEDILDEQLVEKAVFLARKLIAASKDEGKGST